MATERKALGRGLGALIAPPRYSNINDDYFMCPIGDVQPDPEQPRQRFDDRALDELVASIKEKGILQPLVVRKQGKSYIIIAGERRHRAAAKAGLKEVPVLVKDVATDEAFELALIENIQREDLNPIEEASAYQRLLDKPGYTQQVVARKVGKDRSTITNATRLLKLESPLQQLVIDGKLTAGHARSLLSVKQPEARQTLAERIVSEGLSVRQTEAAARETTGREPQRRPRRKPEPGPLAPYYETVARELTQSLGRKVTVASRGARGRLSIEFRSIEDLRKLRDQLTEALQETRAAS